MCSSDLISWNEFSENSHVEPSERNGTRYLQVLADLRDAPGPNAADFDSSEPGTTGSHTGLPLLIGLVLLIVGGIVLTLRRGSGDRSANGGPSSEGASS